MAHKGKDYKLAFRRDFGVNQFTSKGPAESYHVTVGEFTSHAFPDSHTFRWRGRNTHKEAGDQRIWTLDPIAYAGINWAGFVTLLGDPALGIQTCRLDVYTDVHGLELSIISQAPEGNVFIWTGFSFEGIDIVFARGFLIPSIFTYAVTFDAWFWTDGP